MQSETLRPFRLQVVAEADPGALARVLERFQNLNLLPRRVIAEQATNGRVHIAVDVTDLTEPALDLIAAKIAQLPCIINSYWHYL
jgi:hypothetical protein